MWRFSVFEANPLTQVFQEVQLTDGKEPYPFNSNISTPITDRESLGTCPAPLPGQMVQAIAG